MVIIKLTFKKLERNKKISLQLIPSENNEFIEDLDEEIKGKYCKLLIQNKNLDLDLANLKN